jgi:transposase
MPKRSSLLPHLALDELERRNRTPKEPVARSHWRMVWLLAQGQSAAWVAAATGYTANGVRTMARRYNQHGPAGPGDQRHRNPGAAGRLSAVQRAELARVLEQPSPAGGIWTGPKVAVWMAAILGRPIHPRRGWEVLRRLGWMRKIPRPRHAKADPQAQAACKKSLPAAVQALQQAHPQERKELWATDQHRIGPKPILRRVWSPRGQRPGAVVQHRD